MGIFDKTDLFTVYEATLVFRDKCMGGTPRDPRIIEAWLRAKAGVEQQEEIRRMTVRTLLEMGIDVPQNATFAEMEAASANLAGLKSTNGFKRDQNGLYLESRTVKAMLKECVAILYPYQRAKWTVTKKAPRSVTAERVFIRPDRIYFNRDEPDGVELFIGHTNGPKGPQSNLTYYEYVEQASISFQVMVTEDEIPDDAWPRIWSQAEENGLGALRSQGHGRFDIEAWEPVTAGARELVEVD